MGAPPGDRPGSDFLQPPGEESSFGGRGGEVERAAVCRARLLIPPEAAEQFAARRVEVEVLVQLEPLDGMQRRIRMTRLR